MSLGDAPVEASVQIRSAGAGAMDAMKYGVVGVSAGRYARVLARYPGNGPQFVEVELDGERVVTLPMSFAREVFVEPTSGLASCPSTCQLCRVC